MDGAPDECGRPQQVAGDIALDAVRALLPSVQVGTGVGRRLNPACRLGLAGRDPARRFDDVVIDKELLPSTDVDDRLGARHLQSHLVPPWIRQTVVRG